jgi:hypothetical protein
VKLVQYFDRFLRDTVNLNRSRLEALDSRVGSITSALKESAELEGRVLDTIPQGSWAHRTIIRPADGLEFDADFLVQVEEVLDWNANPRNYANAVWKALSDHSTYGPMVSKKDRCVRVTYSNECHVDVVTYVVLGSGQEVIVNRNTNEFEDTNPVGFTEWIQEKDDVTGGNLRKVIRLLKYLRDHRGVLNIRSVLLTTMVGNLVDAWRSYDPAYYKDVPTTLVNLVADLDDWLQSSPIRPSVLDPSCPSTTFDHRWTDAQYESFRKRVHDLRPKVDAAHNAQTVQESVVAWRRVFGDSFPDGVSKTAAATEAGWEKMADLGRDGAAPREQFIEDRFPVDLQYTVDIDCEVTDRQLNRKARRKLKSVLGHVPKSQNLLFKVNATSVPEPFRVYWKVRNRGDEAASRNQLRGEIVPDGGLRQKPEHTACTGHHYVDCYIVKDHRCVARARQSVIIP